MVGDAFLEVTGAYRINYAIFCNTGPALQAHACPRYLSEPEELRKGPPFVYSQLGLNQVKFDYEPDKDPIWAIADVIRKRRSSEDYLSLSPAPIPKS